MRYLFRNIEHPRSAEIDEYEKNGGYRGLKRAVFMEPRTVIEEIKESGLRGRGGAGFPTAMKLSFAAEETNFPKYILCNADEGEPGTFKDRVLLERNPHLVIEGTVIAGLAVGAQQGYIYLRAEYPRARETVSNAIAQAYERKYLGDNLLDSGRRFHLAVHQGAGAYICGEETALIESLEGRRGHPRVKPPFTVNKGYLGKPTVVNNVETLSNIPLILEIGAGAYAQIGTKGSPGPKLFSVSGAVERPGAYELPMGTSLREIIHEHCGGVRGGRALKAVIPGGISTPVLKPDKIDCAMDFLTLSDPECRSMLGSGAVIVFDETACMVRTAYRIARFFEHESCGKCTPCREGTGWLRAVLGRVEDGGGRNSDLKLLVDIAGSIAGKCFCALGESAAMAAMNFLDKFREEFDAHIRERGCAFSASA